MVISTLMQIYIEKEDTVQKEKYRMYSLRRKRARGNLILGPRCLLKEEEKPGGSRRKGSGALRATCHPANPAVCERKRSEGFPSPKKQLQRNAYANVIQGRFRFPPKQIDLTASAT